MTFRRALLVGAWVLALLVLQYTVRPLLGWRVQVDFLVIALLLIAVQSRPAVAAFCGLILGVVTDSLTPGAFGAGALAMTLVGFLSSWLKAVFFTENLVLNAIFIFAGKWTFDLVYLMAARQTGGSDVVAHLLLWSPLAAALTAVVGLAALVASQPATERRR